MKFKTLTRNDMENLSFNQLVLCLLNLQGRLNQLGEMEE